MDPGPKPELEFALESGELLPHVQSYYLYRHDARAIRGVERVDIGQIRFMLKGEGERIFPDGHAEPSCPVMVNGPGTAAATYRIDGPFHCFGVALRAVGWKSFIGLPADRVANCVLDGSRILGAESLDLLERLRGAFDARRDGGGAAPLPARAAAARAQIACRAGARGCANGSRRAIPRSRRCSGWCRWGKRQATRLCNEYFGGPPKLLARKYRAIRAAMRIHAGENPADVVEPFSDQPHMIKEIKQFTGHTPTTLRDGIDPVVAATLANESFHFLPDVIPESVDPGGD
ncbi:MAG: AraC family transcriptional regulator [Sphingomonas sp.]